MSETRPDSAAAAATNANLSQTQTGDVRVQLGETAAASESRRRGASAPAADDEPTKDELYEQAQDLDIEGRSSMTKDELAAAVEAETTDSRKRR